MKKHRYPKNLRKRYQRKKVDKVLQVFDEMTSVKVNTFQYSNCSPQIVTWTPTNTDFKIEIFEIKK